MLATNNAPTASTSRVTLEAQQTLAEPRPALTHAPRTETPSSRRSEDSHDMDTLGYSAMFSRTHDSRHDSHAQSIGEALPAYDEEAAIPLPEYTLHAPEPVTLAMYLFKFGFLFPPFWLFGAFILLSPLCEPPMASESSPSWLPEKTEEERRRIITNIRETEIKWARRCLCAFLAVATLSLVAGASTYLALHH